MGISRKPTPRWVRRTAISARTVWRRATTKKPTSFARPGSAKWNGWTSKRLITAVVTGEIEKANRSYMQWMLDYPADYHPHGNLGVNYIVLGQYEKAVEEMRARD